MANIPSTASYDTRTHSSPSRVGVDPYVRATYSYFLVSLVSMAILGAASYHVLPTSSIAPLCIADGILWIACGWFGWRHPIELTFPAFTLATGLLLGQLAHFFPNVLLVATIVTLFTFGGLSAFVWVSRRNFSFLASFLCVAFFVLLGGCTAALFVESTVYLLCLTGFGVLTFAGWILYDTSRIVHRADEDLTPAVAAFELILDIVGFHRWLLDHLSVWDLEIDL
jgi:FtsH-binding integral membrane protein